MLGGDAQRKPEPMAPILSSAEIGATAPSGDTVTSQRGGGHLGDSLLWPPCSSQAPDGPQSCFKAALHPPPSCASRHPQNGPAGWAQTPDQPL